MDQLNRHKFEQTLGNSERQGSLACFSSRVCRVGYNLVTEQPELTREKVRVWGCVLGHFRHVWLFATLWTIARQAPLSMWFSRQEYWSGLHFLLQAIFLTQGSNPYLLHLLHWETGSLPLTPPGKSRGQDGSQKKDSDMKSLFLSNPRWD